jgi:hypothetical protein
VLWAELPDPDRVLHSAELGPCCPEKQFTGLPPSTEAARHQAHRPRLACGDAPARGTRRGSTDGMAPWRHLTIGGRIPIVLVPDGGLPPRATSTRSNRMETSGAGGRGGGCPSPLTRRWASGGESQPRTRTEAGASRGGGFTARGRARASKCVAEIGEQPRAQRSQFDVRPLAGRAPDRQAGARSRVSILT